MTKQEAIKSMREGKKITHLHLGKSEWMTMDNEGYLLLEDGVKCSLTEFFGWRIDKSWDNGYSFYEH